MKLYLPDEDIWPDPVRSLISSLSKKFKINSPRSIEKAVELACYLYAAGKKAESMRLIESFAFDIEYTEKNSSWGHKIDVLSLLSYIFWENEELEKQKEIINIISSKNFDKDDISWLIDQASEDIDNYLDERPDYEDMKNDLTVNERMLGNYSNIVIFMYYHQMLNFFSSVGSKRIIDKSYGIIQKEIEELKGLLAEREH